METLAKLVGSLIEFLMVFTGLDGNPDRYVTIKWAAPAGNEKKVVPFGRAGEIPHLGPDHNELIEKAEQMYSSDDHRYKWLMARYKLRHASETGYILDKSNKDKKFTKWGLTNLAC